MDITEFVLWAQTYILEQGWNIPVNYHITGFVRIGVAYGSIKSYDDYSVTEINKSEPEVLKRLVIFNLERLKIRLESLSKLEKIKREVTKLLDGKIN